MSRRAASQAVRKLLCRLRGHRLEKFDDGLKRRCTRCAREEWVMSRPYPAIGEAKYYWRHMDWDRP